MLFSKKNDSLFATEGHTRFSVCKSLVLGTLFALGTFQGPGVMGGFLTGEPLALLPSAASRSLPLWKAGCGCSAGSCLGGFSDTWALAAVSSLLELASLRAVFPFPSSGGALLVVVVFLDGRAFSSTRLHLFSGDLALLFPGLALTSFLTTPAFPLPAGPCSAVPSENAWGWSWLPSAFRCFLGLLVGQGSCPGPVLGLSWELLFSPFLGLSDRSLGRLVGSLFPRCSCGCGLVDFLGLVDLPLRGTPFSTFNRFFLSLCP